MSVSKDDVFRTIIAVVIALLAYIGNGIRTEQIDQGCRLRIVELQQARMMERLGIDPILAAVGKLQPPSKKDCP